MSMFFNRKTRKAAYQALAEKQERNKGCGLCRGDTKSFEELVQMNGDYVTTDVDIDIVPMLHRLLIKLYINNGVTSTGFRIYFCPMCGKELLTVLKNELT